MQKFNQLFLAFLTIAIFITCTSTAKQRPEGGWLWKISGNGLSHPSYLFGTHHGTYDILYQYTDSIPELHQAFNACSQFAGESETTSKPTPAQVGVAIKLPKDTTYADLLNKEDFHFLDSIVRQSLKSPLNKVYIKPNFLALILGEIEKGKKLVDTGYSQSQIDSMKSQVMDIALEKKAKEKGLTIVGLEGIFDAFVSEKSNLKKEADELISDLREDDEISPLSFVNTLSDVYRTQNMKSLIDFEVKVDSIFRTSPKLTEIGKRIREDLLKRRNLNWMNKIPELMKAQPTFIAVGVRHLPGKDGLIALLLEKGYQVEPIGL